ncbi:murein DD-endopeptidase MepM/ murein hydrolase activator NlpD [Sphingomonas jinjuensis]|uniref:Murein DD-endopeptidase MepM/ murein hydrolase activator NlpD n=1 Tax=Sphingomonas jinjuensis TaxID=535907 RepID=A0A840F5J6_9SPHN|nr:murein DD-endopeptidase MepM/ murein hydrolase activator NlpD [Sphingomonas jinjuensis]
MKRAAPALGLASALLAGCIPSVERGYDQPAVAPPPMQTVQPLPPQQQDDEPVRRSVNDDAVTSLPAPRPAWEAAPVSADAREVAAQSYTVRPGDTLRSIAERTGAGSEAIARANGIDPPFVIRAGQRLQIPAGRYHLVRPGQSGIAIARAYGVEWSRIVAANDLTEPYILRSGQRIAIPGSTDRPPSVAERAAAFTLDIDDILTGGEPAVAANRAPARPTPNASRVLSPTVPVAPPPRLASGGFVWPVDGRVVKRFGPGASGERSNGIKIAVPIGTPIRATGDGIVAYVGTGIAALGGLVIIKHGGGWASVYGHASKLTVQRGQSVKRGQVIALSGDTGLADRPEVHFELRRGRTAVDPQRELSAP